ncbi:MAG TPA: MarR family transcriptional regulator [Polyangiales bacterium]|jgi:DNA-binding MarR family transcriptional regulator|nr:MarR family transcriptional regulator [Polyangiales bacterium]
MAKATRLQITHEAIERLTRLSELFQLRREQLASSAGLTVSQWSVLEEISTEHFMPSMFAQSGSTSRAAVSKVIRQLLDRNLVQVAISAVDGRQRDYALTHEGKTTLDKLRVEREKAIESIWLPLDPDAVNHFNKFAAELIARIQRHTSKE